MDTIPVWRYIIGIPASAGLDVNVRRLCNWIFAQAKIVNVEYQFARFPNTVCHFVEWWNT